jgi:F-type H+-transporting ATPase subunit gamma
MSTELKEVKQRIQTTREIHKMTSALQMIASAQLQQRRRETVDSNAYTKKLRRLLTVATAGAEDVDHPLLRAGDSNVATVVVFGSNRGLCGPFNGELVKAASEFVAAHAPARIVAVGTVIERRLRRLKLPVVASREQPRSRDVAAAADWLVATLSEEFFSGETGRVFVMYHHFETALRMYPVVSQMLPLASLPGRDPTGGDPVTTALAGLKTEPSPEALLAWLIPEWLHRQVTNALLNSMLAEAAARQAAMARAVENASTMIEELTLHYRRLRQESITTEMLELTGGTLA